MGYCARYHLVAAGVVLRLLTESLPTTLNTSSERRQSPLFLPHHHPIHKAHVQCWNWVESTSQAQFIKSFSRCLLGTSRRHRIPETREIKLWRKPISSLWRLHSRGERQVTSKLTNDNFRCQHNNMSYWSSKRIREWRRTQGWPSIESLMKSSLKKWHERWELKSRVRHKLWYLKHRKKPGLPKAQWVLGDEIASRRA